jgi:hypothetical protein
MRSFAPLALALVTLGCAAGAGPRATLDGYRGAWTTHFGGVPDRAGICAVVTNRGATPIDWVRLRLRSFSSLGPEDGRWTSYWVLRETLMPGESAAFALENPPVADEIELDLRDEGSRATAARGRRAYRVGACNESALRAELDRDASDVGVETHAAVRRGERPDVVFALRESDR